MPLTVALNDIGTGPLQQATIGSVVGVINDQGLILGWLVGQKGRTSHAVMSDEQSAPKAWSLDRLGVAHAIHVAPRSSLVLTVSSNEVNPNNTRSHVGCLGLTQHGLVVCAGSRHDGWHNIVPLYINLCNSEIYDNEMTKAIIDAAWLTNWSLSVKSADDQLIRIIGSPDWAK